MQGAGFPWFQGCLDPMSGFITCESNVDKLFFLDTKYLTYFIKAGKTNHNILGCGRFTELQQFKDSHFDFVELYIEFWKIGYKKGDDGVPTG